MSGRPWLAAYPAGVPHEFDFPQVPLTRLRDDAAQAFPTAVAISYAGRMITYRQLRADVDRLAGSLRDLGVAPGDRVAAVLPNCPQHVITLFAAARIGAISVACNPLATAAELAEQLAMVTPAVVVCLDRSLERLAEAGLGLAPERIVVTSLPDFYPAAARLRLRLPTPAGRADRRRLTAPVPSGMSAFRTLLHTGRPARQTQEPEDEKHRHQGERTHIYI